MAAKKNLALFIAPLALAGEIEPLLAQAEVSRAACDWVDDPRKLVAALRQNRYKVILATHIYFGANGANWYLALRKLAPQAGLILFNGDRDGREFSALRAAESRDPSFIYLPKGLNASVLAEYLGGAQPAGKAAQRASLVAIQEGQQQRAKSIIDRLALQVNAQAAYLVDSMGIVLAHMAASPNYPIGEIGSLLGGSFAALLEVGRLLDEPESGKNFIYRRGEQDDFYAMSLNASLSLVLLVDRAAGTSNLGTVWRHAQAAARDLDDVIAQPAQDAFSILVNEQANQDLEAALDALSGTPSSSENGVHAEMDEEALDGPISFDLAVARGLIQADFDAR